MSMYEVYAITDTGRVRQHNEDGFLFKNVYRNEGEYADSNVTGDWWAAVADGMGGEAAGEIASVLALRRLAGLSVPPEVGELQQCGLDIHKEIVRYGEAHPACKGLGTTLVGLACIDRRITVFYIGDSRAYRFRDGFLKPLTRDHSLVEWLYETGQITREEKGTHQKKHVLLTCLGGSTGRGIPSLEVEVMRGTFEIGDLFLLCSDGVTDYVEEAKIEEIMGRFHRLSDIGCTLVEQANQAGGCDNSTALLIRRTG
jgi:serine/threonine protein phosphatase PrpC